VVINKIQMGISAKQYSQRLKQLTLPVLQEIVNELLIKDEETLKTLKEQDYLQGDIFGDGKTFASYRSPSYANMKRSLNPIAGGKVDLIKTGAFVDAMRLGKGRNGRYLFNNTDSKRNILVEIYGANIFGLNQNVFYKYQKEIIAPRFLREIKLKANIA
jgi:hypothetical protein